MKRLTSETELKEEDEEIPVKKMKETFKDPTVEELNQFREIANLHHSNLFRIQIEAMLSEIKLKPKVHKYFSVWFSQLQQSIEAIAEGDDDQELADLELSEKLEVEIPTIEAPVNEKARFQFLKPTNIRVTGSWPLTTVVGPNAIIDVVIEMPSAMFKKHDYRNYIYMRKRAMYLSYIASHLPSDLVEKKTFVGEPWALKLKIVPAGRLKKRVTVYLHIAAQEGSFNLTRFLPEKNSVKPVWYFNDSDGTSEELIPTPQYNSNILQDLTMAQVNDNNTKMVSAYPNIRDGIILLKIWLYQRQPHSTFEFNGHILTMYVLYLLGMKKINTYMSAYQIVRAVWHSLAQTNWCIEGITMSSDPKSPARVVHYHKYYDCVFLDSTGYHNLTANLSSNNYLWLRSQAEIAVKCLDKPTIDSFQVLFMRRVAFYNNFDTFMRIDDEQALGELENTVSKNQTLDMGINRRKKIVESLISVLKKGLGRRVSQIYVQPNNLKEWEITEKLTSELDPLCIGFELNPDYCFDIIEKGPPANLPEATEFKKFWDEKSELRRFQDGSVCEAVVWEKIKTISERRMMCKKIVTYLLKGKFGVSKEQYQYFGHEIDEFLRPKNTIIRDFSYGTGEEATLKVLRTFSDLEKELLSLTDLPLNISGVQGCSPVLRYTDVYPPLATVYSADENSIRGKNCLLLNDKSLTAVPRYAPAIEATLQLASSGKWPDELEAVQKTKTAFHIQIAQNLRTQFHLKTKAHQDYVDVLKNGYVFRLKIGIQREIGLLKKQIGDDNVQRYVDTEESKQLENQLFHLPQLNGALHGLYCEQPSFGPTCCLTKRWLAAQLIDNFHMPDIVVDLLVAYIYLSPEPYKPAQMPQVNFLRVLEFFAREMWTEAIIVNFNNQMSHETMVEIENNFRTMETRPPLFICTPHDQKSIWTETAPTKLILHRVTMLAREALKFIDKFLDSSGMSWAPIFKPPFSAYQCLIHIKPEFNPCRYQALNLNEPIKQDFWPLYIPNAEEDEIPVIGFNPIQCFLEELRKNYSEFAQFFHDPYGGSVIGVLINPAVLKPVDFKVSNLNCRHIKNNKLVLNMSAMIGDFEILGKGLIDRIEVSN